MPTVIITAFVVAVIFWPDPHADNDTPDDAMRRAGYEDDEDMDFDLD